LEEKIRTTMTTQNHQAQAIPLYILAVEKALMRQNKNI
jgi:hypothetical protein